MLIHCYLSRSYSLTVSLSFTHTCTHTHPLTLTPYLNLILHIPSTSLPPTHSISFSLLTSTDSSDRLCSYIAKSVPCPWGGTCEYSHDPMEYLSRKVPDIGSFCYQYATFGECQNGIMCRYGAHHINYETGNNNNYDHQE